MDAGQGEGDEAGGGGAVGGGQGDGVGQGQEVVVDGHVRADGAGVLCAARRRLEGAGVRVVALNRAADETAVAVAADMGVAAFTAAR